MGVKGNQMETKWKPSGNLLATTPVRGERAGAKTRALAFVSQPTTLAGEGYQRYNKLQWPGGQTNSISGTT